MTPNSETNGGQIWNTAAVASTCDCDSDLAYICEWNRVSGFGTWPDLEDSVALLNVESYKSSLIGLTGVANIPSDMTANAEIGRL